MRIYTQEEVKQMNKETLINEIMNNVYEATEMLEQAGHAGLIHGNGHHMRQTIAHVAKKLIKERWI